MLREADDAADAVFLAVAGDQLNGSLNVDRTMTRVIDLAVPRLADACLLALIDGREVRRMGAVCRGGRIEQWWQTGVPLAEAVAAVARVRATRSAELHAAVTPESLGGLVPDGDQWSPLREPAPHSAMVVPLLARAAPVGALLFLARERPHFARRNLKVAQSFTRRAALALDNAASYRRPEHGCASWRRPRPVSGRKGQVGETCRAAARIATRKPVPSALGRPVRSAETDRLVQLCKAK